MEQKTSGILASQGIFMPQELMQELQHKQKNLYIGIPCETSFQENRIALVPESVAVLVSNGHQVVVETNAGKNANFTDTDFSEAGARIGYSPREVFEADLILKVAPPSSNELELLRDRQTLISILQITMQNKEYIQAISRKKITAMAYEFIKDETDLMPVIQAMSEIVGRTSILIAAEYLSNSTGGKGELLGGITGIPPSEVVIIGAGTVGEFAARTAIGLGAQVKVFDNNIYKLRRLTRNLGINLYTSTVTPSTLLKALRTCDVAVGAIHSKQGRAPVVVTEEMVSEMRYGSVIIDVSIDHGGCFETSEVTNHTEPVFRKYGVIHYCVPNIASRVAKTASNALSNIFTPMLLNIGEHGGLEELIMRDASARSGIYLFRGTVTNKFVSEVTKLPFRDLNLLMASLF